MSGFILTFFKNLKINLWSDMRFILNFIFFGVLFYVIYLFFPDAFHTLVGWANGIYEFLRDVLIQLTGKYHEWKGDHSSPEQALFLIPLWIKAIF